MIKHWPRFLLFIAFLFVSPDHLCAKGQDRSTLPTGFREGVSVSRGASQTSIKNVNLTANLMTSVTKASLTGAFDAQVRTALLPTYNSVITLRPANDALDKKSSEAAAATGIQKMINSNASKVKFNTGAFSADKRLCAGLDLEWQKGNIGMAAFAATKTAENFAYDAHQYWLIKGPHKDGERYNFPTDMMMKFGPEKKFRLENLFRKGNLTITDIKSPYSKIFEGTESPIKDKYSVVNLTGLGSGIGSTKDDWYFLTSAGGNIDTSFTANGMTAPIKGSYLMVKSNISGNFRALAMPVFHKDSEPDFGVGLKLTEDAAWTTAKRGPAEWVMDLGSDEVTSLGGVINQGGLWGKMMQTLNVYLWGANQRAYLNPGQTLCIDTKNAKPRSWLPAFEGWGWATEPFALVQNFFQWPGDGSDGVGRVNLDPYKAFMFPSAFFGVDMGLSHWNGNMLFRFKAKRIKGGSCYNDDCDYGVFITQPIGGINFPSELPWYMPKVKGTADGMFDATSGVNGVLEVSARGGDAALMPGSQTAYGTTLWQLSEIYPYHVVARCAGRGDVAAAKKLKDFFGEEAPVRINPNPATVVSEGITGIKYGATAKLRHKESGNYLCVSKVSLPTEGTVFYLTCTPDSAAAGQWMAVPGLGLAARVGGSEIESGEAIRLVDKITGKTLCGFDGLPPLSLNFGIRSIDDLASGDALLKQYDIPAVAYSGQPPSVKAEYPPSNWIVRPAVAGNATSGIRLQNHGYGGFLSSVNGYCFKPSGSEGYLQEVTVFDSGTATPFADVGDFGTWMIEDLVPAPSTLEEMLAAGFNDPLTLIDGKEVALTHVAAGSNGCLYGVDGAQNAVKIDLTKRTQEQLATGVRQIAVGADDAILMLKTDGTVVLRPSGGADQVVPGCMGRWVGIGNASAMTVISADGGVRGHLMVNQGQQLLASKYNALVSDISDDGYIFGATEEIVTSGATSSKVNYLLIGQKGNTSDWAKIDVTSLPEKIARISVGSSRFIILRGDNGGLYTLKADDVRDIGEELFEDPALLLNQTDNLLAPSAWNQVKVGNNQIFVADCAVASDGLMVALAGQVTENFEFKVFTKSLAPWPSENQLFNMRLEVIPAVDAKPATAEIPAANGKPAVPAKPAVEGRAGVYSEVLVCDNDHGHLEEFKKRTGEAVSTQASGAVAQFCVVSADGYVSLQTKSGQSMKASNSVMGLKKDDKLQNKNLKTGKNNDNVVLAKGVQLDKMLLNDQLAVGFGGEKFKLSSDRDSVLERFMFYPVRPQPDDGSGKIRFKLQSKATGGFLMLNRDETHNAVESLKQGTGDKAIPIPKSEASTFVLLPLGVANLKLQQALVGKNPRDAMTAFETAWTDDATFGDGAQGFFEQLLHWLNGVRIAPNLWMDFSQTTGEWTDPVTKLKKTVTASERLLYLVSDASLLANSIIKDVFKAKREDLTIKPINDKSVDLDALLYQTRTLADPLNAPTNLGLLKNVHDGSVVALRSVWGIGVDGKLTNVKTKIVNELFVAVDPETGLAGLSKTTSIDPNVQFSMKVVPSPLTAERNIDDGHEAADIQRWMFQSSSATDANVKRLFVPTLGADVVIDSKEIALDRFTLQWGVLKDTQAATLLPAYFDVQSVGEKLSSRVKLQSASCSGFWYVGKTDNQDRSLVKEGLSALDSEGAVDPALDLKIRAQDVKPSGDAELNYISMPNAAGDAFEFEIVIITQVLQDLSAAFKKATFDEQVAGFFLVSSRLEKISDVLTFCDAVSQFLTNKMRSNQEVWTAYMANRSAREKLGQCVDNIKKLFAEDLVKVDSLCKFYVENLEKTIDIARVPTFGNTKTRREIITDLRKLLDGFAKAGALDKFVTSGGQTAFVKSLQQAVNDWFSSVGISVSDTQAQADGTSLQQIIQDYKNALGMSLSKTDTDNLDSMIATLTNANPTVQINPVDILQNIVTLNTVNDIVTFGSDAKCSFMKKLWELYKASTLDLELGVSVLDAEKKTITSRGVVFGLTPTQINQLTEVIRSVTRPPVGSKAAGGPFFADDGRKAVREEWKWTEQEFADITNTQIINQLSGFFVVPTFTDFVVTYLQYFSAQQDVLAALVSSEDPKEQSQALRFAVRLLVLAEQWSAWKKAAIPRQQRQELNQFKLLVRGIKPFVRNNQDLKGRVEKLLAVIQSAIDQLS